MLMDLRGKKLKLLLETTVFSLTLDQHFVHYKNILNIILLDNNNLDIGKLNFYKLISYLPILPPLV